MKTRVAILVVVVVAAGLALVGIRVGRISWSGNFLHFKRSTSADLAGGHPALIEVEALRAAEKNRFLFIDARPPLFFKRGHIPGALNIAKQYFVRDFSNAEATLRRGPSKPIIVYCSTEECDDAMAVAQELLNSGMKNVSVLSGGWKAWCAAALPQEKG